MNANINCSTIVPQKPWIWTCAPFTSNGESLYNGVWSAGLAFTKPNWKHNLAKIIQPSGLLAVSGGGAAPGEARSQASYKQASGLGQPCCKDCVLPHCSSLQSSSACDRRPFRMRTGWSADNTQSRMAENSLLIRISNEKSLNKKEHFLMKKTKKLIGKEHHFL